MEKCPKPSYFHHIGNDPLMAITLGNLLERSATKFSQREVIISREQKQTLTYWELLQKADRFAAALRILGLQKGDRVGIWATNIIEWSIVNMGIVRGGFYTVTLNPQYQAAEMEYNINKVGIKILICPYKNKYQNFYDVLTQIVPELLTNQLKKFNNQKVPSLEGVIIISDEKLNGTYNYYDIMTNVDPETIRNIKNSQNIIDPDDPCYIMFSSGTTGKPKAAVLSHFQLVNNAFLFGKNLQFDKKHHKVSVPVPLFHVFGVTLAIINALHFGCTLVFPSSGYSPLENLKTLKEEKCTVTYGTPTMYSDLINIIEQTNANVCLDIAVIGGAGCSPKLLKRIKKVFKIKRVEISYGMTECSPLTFKPLPNEEDEFKLTLTVGHVGEHLEVKIIDKNGRIVPMGTPGELCVRGYCTMLGYWEDIEKTKEMIGVDKWLKTGDQMILYENGYGSIVGRLKDVIIRGGENIYPKEIEDILSTHSDILEVQVIGLPHDRLGEEVCACVKLKQGSELTQKSLAEYLKGKIAFCKIPSQLRQVEEFPKTASGKIQKYLLKDYFTQQNDK